MIRSPFHRILAAALLALIAATLPAAAQTALSLTVGEGRDLTMPPGASSVLVSDPGVADAQATSPTSIFVTGISPGRTNIIVRDADARPVMNFAVRVRRGTGGAGQQLGRSISLTETDNGAVLTGEAYDVGDAQTVSGARRALDEQGQLVTDRTVYAGPNQVSLRVRFVEASRTEMRRIGLNVDALGRSTAGPLRVVSGGAYDPRAFLGQGVSPGSPAVGGRMRAGSFDVDGMIDALEVRGAAQILAEPTLTTVSGQSASFQSGGEFGYEVNQGDGVMATAFKQYGISVEFTPTILPNNRIAVHVTPEVSYIDDTRKFGQSSVPNLNVRRADTTVEVASGQTFAIAGLYEQYSSNSTRGAPGLGHMLGRTGRQRDERELIIFITPYLADASDSVERRPERPAPQTTVGFIAR